MKLVPVPPEELSEYKADMQAAFQKGFEDVFGKTDAVILPADFVGDGNEGMFEFEKQMPESAVCET